MAIESKEYFEQTAANVAKELLLKMVDTKMLFFEVSTSDPQDQNQKNVEEVCQHFKKLYKTVILSMNGSFEE